MARTPELVSSGGSSQVNGVALVLPGGMTRFEVVGDGHYLLRRAIGCWAASTGFVLGARGMRPLAPDIAEATNLRTPLPVGVTV